VDLHSFAKNGNIKGIKQFLKNKRAMLALDEDMGWSPLHYASNSSKAKIVQLILNAGISPNIKSAPPKKQKQSDWNLALQENENSKAPIVYPMDVAGGSNRLKIINNLKEKGGKFYGNEMTLQQAVQMEDIDEIETLLEDDEIKINGTAVMRSHAGTSSHDTPTTHLNVHLKRGDYIQSLGTWYGNMIFNNYQIERV